MNHFYAVIGAAQTLAHLLGDHHGAMLAPGATERDREIDLAFVYVMRNQIDQQVGDAGDELAGLRTLNFEVSITKSARRRIALR